MRLARSLVLTALLAAVAVPAAAQASGTPAAPGQSPALPAAPPVALDVTPGAGEIEFGGRLTSVSGDSGRYQRLRDRRSGPTIDRLRYVRDRDTWMFTAAVDHAGYRDQRYVAAFERIGHLKVSFDWNQVPLHYGDSTRTPFRSAGNGILRLDDALQAAVQNRTATPAIYAAIMEPVEVRSSRDVAAARVTYAATRELDLHLAFTSTARTGQQPWGASFGFSNAIELAAPVDHRTNDLGAAAEWSNRRATVRLAYDGSWFDNRVESLVWDNPLRSSDQTHPSAYSTGDGSSQGRMALWPDSTAHTISASGSLALPGRTRAFALVSVGTWLQDAQLLPHTINTAIAPIALDRASAEAEARITSMSYRVTSRPSPVVWLSGQYRLYDYDNRTPHFAVAQYVRLDGNPAASATGGSEPFGYQRHFVDLDASFTPLRFVAFRAGYGQQRDHRTYRFVEETADHTLRASIDSSGLAWGSVRLQYDHAVRTGTGLDEEAFSDIGEQISLRQFDISDRTRDRVSAIVQVSPFDALGFNGSASVGRETRPDAAFGLQDNGLRAFTVGVDLAPSAAISAGLSYGFERYSTFQRSRQASPGVQFNDPTRDWATDMDERVHTLSFSVDVPHLTDRMSATAGYDVVGSRARYLYLLEADTTLAPVQQLPAVRNVVHAATVDVRRTFTRQLALGVSYRFDHYDVEDFARAPGTLNSPLIPAYVNLMDQWRPYDAHTGSVRLIYGW